MSKKEEFDLVFAVMASREVDFFIRIADYIKSEKNINIGFISYYEPGDKVILDKGYRLFSLHQDVDYKNVTVDEDRISKIQDKYKINNIRSLITHEKYTFNKFNETRLLKKLVAYDMVYEKLFKEYKIKFIVQELAGFIAPLVVYYNSLIHQVNHIFLEPSLFKSQLLFNVNSIDVRFKENISISEQEKIAVREYIQKYHSNKPIAIPDKDKHHFSDMGIKKIINLRNIKRLSEKVFFKYFRKEKEEVDDISNKVKKAFKMYVTRKSLSSFYSKPDYSKKYIYFPLHVPLDFQLTVREKIFLNQLAFIEYIASILPYGMELWFKEHPASIGAYNLKEIKRILKNKNLKLIYPKINSYDLIKKSHCVLTINSKVGAEALMQGKKIILVGNPYYKEAQGIIKIDKLDDVEKMDFSLKNVKEQIDYEFFYKLYSNSLKGELYNNTAENIEIFSNSLNEITNF